VPRSAGDSWDIVTSVGATALAVATMRAIEARKHAPLARDDYAQHFVAATAAQAPVFSELLNDPAAAEEPDVDMLSIGGTNALFRRVLRRSRCRRDPPGRTTGGGTGRPGLSSALADGHHGLRSRPSEGTGV
jgi:hypothetical protein